MQPTEQQVQRSLDALLGADKAVLRVADDVAEKRLDEVPTEVLRRLDQAPAVRSDRLERARRRLAAGDGPTAEALAGLMVGRLVCDRLR